MELQMISRVERFVGFRKCSRASQVVPVVRNPPASAGNIRDTGWIPGSGRSPRGEHGNPLQCSCQENPMDSRLQSIGLQRVRHNEVIEH